MLVEPAFIQFELPIPTAYRDRYQDHGAKDFDKADSVQQTALVCDFDSVQQTAFVCDFDGPFAYRKTLRA